jgi:hypothetical protein
MDASQFLNWQIAIAVLSGVLGVASVVPYIWDMLYGDTRPNAVSMILWTVLNIIAAGAQWDAGARWSVVVTATVAFNCIIVTLLILKGYGVREYGWVDGVSLLLAVVAIVVWQANPVYAIVCAIIADVFASIPTIVKVYGKPRSENLSGWAMITVSALLSTISAEELTVGSLAMPIYLTVSSGAIFSIAYFRRK